jgi:radical SAM superfamily enzyme YgiQ (UPF0313 family)
VVCICFNVPTDYYTYYLRTAKKIKKIRPDIPIIFGGIHSSSAFEEVLKNDFIDYAAIGEGEFTIVEIVRYLQGIKTELPQGIAYKKDNSIIKNKAGEFVFDLDSLPFPDKSLFYDKAGYLSTTYTIFTTRGCPYNCSYCINNFWYGELYPDATRVRRRSVDNVISELLHAKQKYNISSIMFEDDIFYLSSTWHWEFIEKYKKNISLPFVCVMHPSHCQDYEVLKSLKDAGCIQVEIGIQTLNEKVRKKYLNRNETNREIYKALYNLYKAGLKYNIDHIAGLPEDSLEYHLDAVRLYSDFYPNRILLFFITNYPSTEIEKISLEKGDVTLNDIENMRKGLGETDETTGSVSIEQAEELERLRFLFGWLPYTKKTFTKFLVNTGLYKFLPVNRILTKILPSIIATLTGGEPRGEVILKKYIIEILKFKWLYKFK